MKSKRAAGARASAKPKVTAKAPAAKGSRARKPASPKAPTQRKADGPRVLQRKLRSIAEKLDPPKVGRRGAKAGTWTPDKPLPLVQQEQFCLRYCTGWYSAGACYREAYPTCKPESSYELASQLLKKPEILARIDHLRTEAAAKATFTKADAIQMCVGILKTPVGALDVHSPLIEGVDRHGNPVMPSKLGTMNTLIAMQGWKAVEEVEVKLTYEPPEAAMQRAAAAGIDVEALLKKVLPRVAE